MVPHRVRSSTLVIPVCDVKSLRSFHQDVHHLMGGLVVFMECSDSSEVFLVILSVFRSVQSLPGILHD